MPYLFNEATKSYTDDSNSKVTVIVGDNKDPSKEFLQAKFTVWDEESNFSLRVTTDEEVPDVATKDGKITWETSKIKANLFNLEPSVRGEDGGFKIELFLLEKPKSNCIPITLNTPKNLNFYRQPELTQEEIDQGHYRPENVVNSWAVYHSKKSGNYTALGGKNYKTGKALHLYRLWCRDARGEFSWVDLVLPVDAEGNLLAPDGLIVIPEKYFDSAVAPIYIDPEFGYTSVGASNAVTANTFIRGSQYTSGADFGVATGISVYTKGDASINVRTAIYDSSFNKLVEDSGNVPVTTTAQWYSSSINYTGSPSTNYKLCWTGSDNYYVHYDTGGGTSFFDDGNTFGTWPATISGQSNSTSRYSIYLTYTAAGAGGDADYWNYYRDKMLMGLL